MFKSKEAGGKSGNTKKSSSLRLDSKALKALNSCVIERETGAQKIIEALVGVYSNAPKKGRP